ncbi:190_t:CDS:1 [Ambispora leptoticha]|uniref:190_t:CDS:1 n=1 Tax=Ambispora leptoticha TaxID=144679 RepID=A0A9N9DBG9_9GLOM|nr:190_t:CDS:1 [Ambispora leptoticha]
MTSNCLLGKPVALNFQLNFINEKNLNQQEQIRENAHQIVIPQQNDGSATSNRIVTTKTSDIAQITSSSSSTDSYSSQSTTSTTTTQILESITNNIATIISNANEHHNHREFSPHSQEQESTADQDSASSHEDALHPTAQILLQDRRHRNLIASKKYRAKKQALEKAMQEQLTNLSKEATLLTKENEALKLENESLKAIISRLTEQLVDQRVAIRQLDVSNNNNNMGIITENEKPKDSKHRSKRRKAESNDHGKKNNPIRVRDDFESD